MSSNLDSWESITKNAEQLFTKNAPPFFDEHILVMISQLIGALLGRITYTQVRTRIVLPEPICTINNTIYISVPLVAMYINQPIQLPETKICKYNNFNIFNAMQTIKCAKRPTRENIDACTSSRHIIDLDAYAASTSSLDESLFSDNTVCTTNDTFSTSDMISLIHLYRVLIMVQHWWKHHTLGVQPPLHTNFHDIEFARRPHKYYKAVINNYNDDDDCTTDDDSSDDIID